MQVNKLGLVAQRYNNPLHFHSFFHIQSNENVN